MAAITLVTTTPHVTNPEIVYSYYWGIYGVDPGPPQIIKYGQQRAIRLRKTYTWTATGSRGDRDLPASAQASPGTGYYLDGRGFTPQPGSDVAAKADGSIYGTYYEHWVNETGREYEDPDDPGTWIAI